MPKSIWDELRPGKLKEGRDALALLIEGGHPRGLEIYLHFRAGPLPRIASSNPGGRPAKGLGGPIFLRFDYVRRPRVAPKLPKAVLSGEREALWPLPSKVRVVRAAGAKRIGAGGVWTISRAQMTPELAAMTGPAARDRMLRAANRRAVRPGAVGRYQQYIDGLLAANNPKSASRIETVDGVPSLLGNVGVDPVVRAASWDGFEATLRGAAARIQYRILLYLPPSFTPAERRAAVELFAARVFEPYGIQWAAAIHRPVPNAVGEDGTDHAHIVFAPIEPERMRALSAQEDRVYLQLGWPRKIKETAAEVFNEVYWRSKRRSGMSPGEPIFFVADSSHGKSRNTDWERRRWRADRKREQVGLPTSAQRQALNERANLPVWMSPEPLLPSLEAAVRLWRALVPGRHQHEPQVTKALAYLRNWTEKLLQTFYAEVDEAFEVATYLALPLRTPRSELMEVAADRLRRIGSNSIRDHGRPEYITAYGDLSSKARQGVKTTGQFGREYADTLAAIAAVEGTPAKWVASERHKLAGYHALMIRTLQARARIFEQLEATIRTIESLRVEDLARPHDPETLKVAIAVDLAANGYGVTLPGPDRNGVFQDGATVRPYTLQLDGLAKAKEYVGGWDDPWLQDVPLKLAESFPQIWSEARTRARRAMFDRAAVLGGLNRHRSMTEGRAEAPVPEKQRQVGTRQGGQPIVPPGGLNQEARVPDQPKPAHSQSEPKEVTFNDVLASRRLPKQRPGHEH